MYYLRQRTQISGPFTVDQLKSLLHRGRVARSDKVSTDKQTWILIADCPDIAHRPSVVAEQAVISQPAATVAASDGIEWFYTQGGAEQPAAVGTAAIAAMIAAGTLGSGEMVWRQGFDEWKPVSDVPEFAAVLPSNLPDVLPMPVVVDLPPAPRQAFRGAATGGPDVQAFVGKKVSAGLAALLIGPLGIHKFILGLTTGGIVMLLLCLLVVPIPFLSIVSFVEGILYLTKADDAFYRDYAIRKKQWF